MKGLANIFAKVSPAKITTFAVDKYIDFLIRYHTYMYIDAQSSTTFNYIPISIDYFGSDGLARFGDRTFRNRCAIEVFVCVFVMSNHFLEFWVGVKAFVKRLSQISSFFCQYISECQQLSDILYGKRADSPDFNDINM